MNERKKIRISESEMEKPFGFTKDGMLISFANLCKFPYKLAPQDLELSDFDTLSELKKTQLVLERLRFSKKNLIEMTLGGKILSLDKKIQEVAKNSEEGKKLVEIEINFLKRLKQKFENGEIEL